MTTKQKKAKLRRLAKEMLKQSHDAMCSKIDTVLDCGCLDIESWNEIDCPMLLPKSIVTALLQIESAQYDCAGTALERKIKREVKTSVILFDKTRAGREIPNETGKENRL